MKRKYNLLQPTDWAISQAKKEVRTIWAKSRPNYLAILSPEQLQAAITDAATNWQEMKERLIAQGVPPKEADNEARREWVVLPDLPMTEDEDQPPVEISNSPKTFR